VCSEDDWSDGEHDAFGGEECPDAASLMEATKARVKAAAAAGSASDDFRAQSAARRAEYSSAGHAVAGPAYGRRFCKE
jgi:hypothetical protein